MFWVCSFSIVSLRFSLHMFWEWFCSIVSLWFSLHMFWVWCFRPVSLWFSLHMFWVCCFSQRPLFPAEKFLFPQTHLSIESVLDCKIHRGYWWEDSFWRNLFSRCSRATPFGESTSMGVIFIQPISCIPRPVKSWVIHFLISHVFVQLFSTTLR